uniref:Pre-mRNA-splicing factor ISY n=1 Tax=Ananas comosus var. bracteatus TaxID=296719 RepID=A0A6V7NSV0_ANACO|nr:unnamed protein product [Ananas comosus var. bracteatus]
MARNEEKAQSMLNRFIAMKQEEKRKPKERQIQNEGLGEHRLRDLNDEINKLLRERAHWERRIVELGGANYARGAPRMTDLEGNIVDVPNPSGRSPGYRYFGAAKKLPGVLELFEKPPEEKRRHTRYDIYKRIDASYYGYCDNEDGVLERLEGPAEAEMWEKAVAEWRRLESIRREAMKAVKSGEVATAGAPEQWQRQRQQRRCFSKGKRI